jgi:manganese oxidase
MKRACKNRRGAALLAIVVAAVVLIAPVRAAMAAIDGISGTVFNLTVKEGTISTADGNSLYFWGYANEDGVPQYPGPTLIVNQGDQIEIRLANDLPEALGMNVSIVFPGQQNVQAAGGSAGVLTQEAVSGGGIVSYTFTATHPGTYLYRSGTRPDLQVEMGLMGAIIVRPNGFNAGSPTAYGHPDSAYDIEDLFLLSEMDPRIHKMVELHGPDALSATDYLSSYFPNYWFINGRTAMDTMADPGVPWLPAQPYNSMPMMHPGQKLMMRVVNGGRDLHPFHHHGNHARVIARNGRLLQSAPGAGADLSHEVFTIQSVPGQTVDAIFEWTGKAMGWDIYGDPNDPEFAHECMDMNGDGHDDMTYEWCEDHGKPFPVVLPDVLNLTFGGFWSGSPFLGSLNALPPGEGGLNPYGGYTYMWHSHTEKEMVNYDIFPGGMMTMLIVVPPGMDMMD